MLELEGHEVWDFELPEQALSALEEPLETDLVLMDFHTGGLPPDRFSLELRELFARQGRSCPKLGVVSGSSEIESCASLVGADFFIRKPFQLEEVISALGFQAA